MNTIRVKYIKPGYRFNSKSFGDGTEHLGAWRVVRIAMEDTETGYDGGVFELMEAKQRLLEEMVARLIQELPTDRWLEVAGAEGILEEVR